MNTRSPKAPALTSSASGLNAAMKRGAKSCIEAKRVF
jgi:hypothetical protein